MDWQRYRWWAVAALRESDSSAIRSMSEAAVEFVASSNVKIEVGRIVFELGAAFKGDFNKEERRVFGVGVSQKECAAIAKCISKHNTSCSDARTAIECWLVVGRRAAVAKDIRHVIAKLLWADRAAWCNACK